MLPTHHSGTKCVLFVFVTVHQFYSYWGRDCRCAMSNQWYIEREVMNKLHEKWFISIKKKSNLSFDSVRGLLNSIYDASYNTGIVVSYFLGSHLNLVDQAKIQLILPAIFIVVQFALPESPVYWMKRKNEEVCY